MGNSVIRGVGLSLKAKITLAGFSILIKPKDLKIKIAKKSKEVIVRDIVPQNYWERHGIKQTKKVILYKKVSKDFKTQENTANETTWEIGRLITHTNWNPTEKECGGGKFHACAKPYFCDEFRNERSDRYIAIEIKLSDTYEWTDDPSYPHKIGFREGLPLYECDRFGRKL